MTTGATSGAGLLQSNRQSIPLQRQTDNVPDRHLEHREAAHAGVASALYHKNLRMSPKFENSLVN